MISKSCFSGQWLICDFVGQVPARLKQPESPVLVKGTSTMQERFFHKIQPLAGSQCRRFFFSLLPQPRPLRKTEPSSSLHTNLRTERAEQPHDKWECQRNLLQDGDEPTVMCECHHSQLQQAPRALRWARAAFRGRGDERNLPEPRSLHSQDFWGQVVPVSRKMK